MDATKHVSRLPEPGGLLLERPRYCVIGSRPVKAVATLGGGMDVLAFDWATGGFRREMRYLVCITLGEDPDLGISAMDVDFLTESEFEQRVRRLREELRSPEGLEPE